MDPVTGDAQGFEPLIVDLTVRGDRGTLVFFGHLTPDERGRFLELAFQMAVVTTAREGPEFFGLVMTALDRHTAATEVALRGPSDG